MSDDQDEQMECDRCADVHPVGVLEDGLCPFCMDDSFGEISNELREFALDRPPAQALPA